MFMIYRLALFRYSPTLGEEVVERETRLPSSKWRNFRRQDFPNGNENQAKLPRPAK